MNKDRDPKSSLFSALSLFLIVAAIVGLVWAWSVYQQTTKPTGTSSLTVSDQGKVTVKPDLAIIDFSVVTQGADPKTVQKDNDAKMTDIVAYLKSQGIDEKDIKTASYNLNPQYDYTWCRPDQSNIACPAKLSGYILTQGVELKLRDLSKVGEIIGNLPAKGTNEISSIYFTVDDQDIPKIEAREQALEKAMTKAVTMAKAAGIKLGKVLNISENGNYYQTPSVYASKDMTSTGSGVGYSAPIQTGSNEITVDVSITYEIK